MKISHVFFDLDHTLWDFEANAEKAYEACFVKQAIKVDLIAFMKYYRPINHNYWKAYREERVTKEALKYGRLEDTFKALDYKVTPIEIDLIAADFLQFLPTFTKLFKGSIALLDYLKPKYRLHIITNGFSEVQMPKLKNSGLLKYFDTVITSESVGVKKPNPKIFEYALTKANALASESVMIGDSLEADIEGADKVGMHSLFFNPNKTQVAKEIKQVTELVDIKAHI